MNQTTWKPKLQVQTDSGGTETPWESPVMGWPERIAMAQRLLIWLRKSDVKEYTSKNGYRFLKITPKVEA